METTLYQLELDQSLVNCGMSYVFHMGENEFFLIDGGYFTEGEDDRLLAFLRSLSTGRPIIRGWLFTHAHQDHIGCFMNFLRHHRQEADIRELLFQFQPLDFSGVTGSWMTKCNDLATVQEFYKILAEEGADIPVHRLETGEVLTCGTLTLEVLCTADNILPKVTSFNDYSAVVRVTVGGQSLLFLGDIQKEGSRFLLEEKRDRLKSTFVQVSHHGFNGATSELYRAIRPEIALFPTPDFEFPRKKDSEVNQAILTGPELREVYVSGHGTAMFRLPYVFGSAQVQPKAFFARPAD